MISVIHLGLPMAPGWQILDLEADLAGVSGSLLPGLGLAVFLLLLHLLPLWPQGG